jgi:O-antigen/teichoic acid export membrane protein
MSEMKSRIGRSGWISVAQVGQVLLAGTDLIVVGKLLGPEAAVVYACTGKLPTLLGNQAQMFMQMALPALSELRAGAPREQMFNVSSSLTQALLLFSGAIAVTVLAVNQPFVSWWVGPHQSGGVVLTSAMLVAMLLRHVNLTLVYTLFCFGYERRLALTTIADGLVGTLAMMILVPIVGLSGVLLAQILATCAVSIPINLIAMAREAGASPTTLLGPIRPWLVRFVPVAVAVAALGRLWTPTSLLTFAALGATVGLVYIVAMIPVLKAPPLSVMLARHLQPWIARVPYLARQIAKPANALAP